MAKVMQPCTRCGVLTSDADLCFIGGDPICPHCVPHEATEERRQVVFVPSQVNLDYGTTHKVAGSGTQCLDCIFSKDEEGGCNALESPWPPELTENATPTTNGDCLYFVDKEVGNV
jgi:hypothetical protein